MLRLTLADKKNLIRIRWYLEDRRNYPIHIPDLAKRFGMRESMVVWGFRRLFGMSIHQYYYQQRMHHAKQMIQEGATVKVATFTLGYSAPANFSRAFKRFYGYNPSDGDCSNGAGKSL